MNTQSSKKIYVIGMGSGDRDYILPIALRTIKKVAILIATQRILDMYAQDQHTTLVLNKNIKSTIEFVRKMEEDVAFLVSGDPLCYSILPYLQKNFSQESIEVIPGISSAQIAYSKFKIPQQDAPVVSIHGRDKSLLDSYIHKYSRFALLIDQDMTVQEIASKIIDYGYHLAEIHIGDCLGTDKQTLVKGLAEDIIHWNQQFTNSVLLIDLHKEKTNKEKHINKGHRIFAPGIDDCHFIQGDIPMTKQEIRSILLSKLVFPKHGVFYDIGAGTGSISIELGLMQDVQEVHSMERNHAAIQLLKQNIQKFAVDNIHVHHGEASEIIPELPLADGIIVGGSGGYLQEILHSSYKQLKANGILAITGVTLETPYLATQILEGLGMKVDICSVNISRASQSGSYHLWKSNNPVFIIWGCKGEL
ncbi:hypothetical protein BHU72_07935 [Desulfuribacillus stibiiarsenatis]|uniref:Tetrapyrrole methylase domain-containing protein n=1 Tax=Desulfuribacillus stibiiarsenatis TaxID=1390249 RepID=A0A1E5L3T5_9FIRM|nr:bifunctional cobalt-precorrin-7 (C(5))-methyltransferase/cobalt-precorrin-6B (C(15))-methyltransferase [Desulfuribacillus stibiiarsenatis]OEH84754.1 hypothetical protein BHU72_07935 [Desulfuribacillus stibiiarsenatis]